MPRLLPAMVSGMAGLNGDESAMARSCHLVVRD